MKLESTMTVALSSDLRSADGASVIPAGSLAHIEFDPTAAVHVTWMGKGVTANFREIEGAEIEATP